MPLNFNPLMEIKLMWKFFILFALAEIMAHFNGTRRLLILKKLLSLGSFLKNGLNLNLLLGVLSQLWNYRITKQSQFCIVLKSLNRLKSWIYNLVLPSQQIPTQNPRFKVDQTHNDLMKLLTLLPLRKLHTNRIYNR